MAIQRSPEMNMLAYFLVKYADTPGRAKNSVPRELDGESVNMFLKSFHSALGDGRTLKEFVNSVQGTIGYFRQSPQQLVEWLQSNDRWSAHSREQLWSELQRIRFTTPSRLDSGISGGEQENTRPVRDAERMPTAIDIATPPERAEAVISRIIRDTAAARNVKVIHSYRCQICGETLELSDGTFYAEAHHIRPLGHPHDGPDISSNILCLCPNHHAALDFGAIPIDLATLRVAPHHRVSEESLHYHHHILYRGR